MSFFNKTILFSSLIGMGLTAHAGTMGDKPNFSGVYAGAGVSYLYAKITGKTNISMPPLSPQNLVYITSNALTDHFAPVVNAGYFYDLHNNWFIGAKGVYKYIGVNQFDQSWSGTFQDGTYQSASLHTKLVQDFFLLFDGGYQFDKWLLYAGVGPAGVTTDVELNGTMLPASSTINQAVNKSSQRTILGGAAQIGAQYLLPNRFSIDLSYNFTATSSKTLSTLKFFSSTSNGYSAFKPNVQVVEQGINVTINKYFS
jgi:outer membrane protein W